MFVVLCCLSFPVSAFTNGPEFKKAKDAFFETLGKNGVKLNGRPSFKELPLYASSH